MTENTENHEHDAEAPKPAESPNTDASAQLADEGAGRRTESETSAGAGADNSEHSYVQPHRNAQERTREAPRGWQPPQSQYQEQPSYPSYDPPAPLPGYERYDAGEQFDGNASRDQNEYPEHYPWQGVSPDMPGIQEQLGRQGRYPVRGYHPEQGLPSHTQAAYVQYDPGEYYPEQAAGAQKAYAQAVGVRELYAQEPRMTAAYTQQRQVANRGGQSPYMYSPAQGSYTAQAYDELRQPYNANVNAHVYLKEDRSRYGEYQNAENMGYPAYPTTRAGAESDRVMFGTSPFATADQSQQASAAASAEAQSQQAPFDFDFVKSTARIALYDDLRSAPKVTEITPNTTAEYIESLASKTYEQAKLAGGTIPYTVIREVSENFIHARFAEVTVSIFDGGNTIRFADQGPGIKQKEKAKLPGFTSAIEPMKRYIRGVGSGLPIVKEYLEVSHGTISIEDNLGTGAVVTISLQDHPSGQSSSSAHANDTAQSALHASVTGSLTQREKDFLSLFLDEGALGVTDLGKLTGLAASSTHATLKKLEEHGLVEKTTGQKRILTDLGFQAAENLR